MFEKLFSKPIWKQYEQTLPKNFDYMVSNVPEKAKKAYAIGNAKNYVTQFNESVKLVYHSKNPDVFFERYKFAIERGIILIRMRKYVKIDFENNPEKSVNTLITEKQLLIHDFIERFGKSIEDKLITLKTVVSKQKNFDKFKALMQPYLNELSTDNLNFLEYTYKEIESIYLI